MTKTISLTDVQSIYEDMVNNYQSFSKGENGTGIEGITPYRLVEIKRGKLQFHSNKFGGSELCITGNIHHAEKVDEPNNAFSEYRIHIIGCIEPLVLLACKK